MKIYAFIFLATCCMLQQSYASSSEWKEILLIRQQIRKINSIVDRVLMPLKIAAIKKGTLEAYGCYDNAKSKLSDVQQIGYSNVSKCIKNSSEDIAAGIVCAIKEQETVREASSTISAGAIKCLSDLEHTCTNDITKSGEMIFHEPNSSSEEILSYIA